jgi:hypothetical protein
MYFVRHILADFATSKTYKWGRYIWGLQFSDSKKLKVTRVSPTGDHSKKIGHVVDESQWLYCYVVPCCSVVAGRKLLWWVGFTECDNLESACP